MAGAVLDEGVARPGPARGGRPGELRARADAMDPAEVLGSYTIVRDAAELIGAYQPLVTDIGADMVSIQVASAHPLAAIRLIGQEVLPKLRSLAPTKAS